MKEYWKNDNRTVVREALMPVAMKGLGGVDNSEELLVEKPRCVSFKDEGFASFKEAGAYVILDFGKELCGGLQIVIRSAAAGSRFRITFGESLTEACSAIGEKNATNDHSARDFEVSAINMSDQTFGMTGFRFARIELISGGPVNVRNFFAVSTLPYFPKEGYIKTNDEELNRIIDTAIYTLKLNFQNGYIWDGIKRDRLVWSGDLNQEIIGSLYFFGDNENITNSLSFLKDETPEGEWINTIPTYSAWWVINLCDYCRRTGNTLYFEENRAYAEEIMEDFNHHIAEDGTIDFKLPPNRMSFYLDWPTFETQDAVIGTAMIILFAANQLLFMQENKDCREIRRKLKAYLDMPCQFKQTRAFQILAGSAPTDGAAFLEHGGADGFSTFMTYYILSADAMAGGKNMLSIIKQYYGAMLSRGATTFWEDFHMDWLEGSGRIDEFPAEGQKDLHGDYGAFCYQGFRHSLCHGWSSGVLAFLVEHLLGLTVSPDGQTAEAHPNLMGLTSLEAKLPWKDGWIEVKVKG